MLLGLGIYAAWPAQALAKSLVRFVHAVPGAGTATVVLTEGSNATSAGSIAFGQSTKFASVRTGHFAWRLTENGKSLASGSATVGSGAYTAILLAKNSGVSLGLFKDQPGVPGKSLIRVIHAAPELGSPSLKFDGQVADSRLDFTAATPYLTVDPGVHSFAAMTAGRSAPILAGKVSLQNDVSYTAVVVGSRGEQVRIVTVTDKGASLTRHASSTTSHHASAPTAAAATSGSASGTVVVHSGDSRWSIARAHLGAGASNEAVEHMVVAIWNANAARIGTGDPNLIFPGQRLRWPH